MRFNSKRLVLSACTALLLCLLAIPSVAAGPSSVKIVVLPFQINAGEDLSYLQESLPELVSDRLREAGFTVVSPEAAGKAIAEKGVDIPDAASAREVALLTGADFAVYGNLSKLGETLSIDAQLVEAFGLKAPQQIFVTKEGLINLLPAVDELVENLKMGLLSKDKITEIEVDGTQVLDREVVLMRLGITKGDIFDPRSINKELKAIYDLGYFDDVRVSVDDAPGGKKVIFTVKEKPRIQALSVVGASEIDGDDIIASVSTKKGAVLNPKVLADDIKTIREMYRKDGYYKAKITHEVEESGNGQARLNFVIDEGPQLYVTDIIIDGAQELDADDIKDELALREKDWLWWYNKSGVFNEPFMERDAAAIVAYYNNRGFMDVKVGKPEVDITDTGIHVTYKVIEGPRYKMGKVNFAGDLIADPEKLREVIGADELEVGEEYFNRSVIQQDMQSLTSFYNNYGYAYADVGLKVDKNDSDLIIGVTFMVAKHQKVHIRRVLLEGNTKTRDNVILREMRLADGDQFSGQDLKRSSQRLDKLGFFSAVDIEPLPTGDPNEVDLRVKVKDKNTGRIGGGAGYSSFDGIFVAGDIQERNLFGKGYDVALNAKFGEKNTVYSFGFMNPHVYDSKLGMGTNIWNSSTDMVTYERDSTGGSLLFSYPLGEYSNLYWDYSLDFYKIYDLATNASSRIKENEGDRISSSASVTFKRDTLDNNYLPSGGSETTLKFVNAGGVLAGDDNYMKYIAKHKHYFQMFGDLVFMAAGEIGFVGENLGGDDIPLVSRFRLGGMGSVRGYDKYMIGPQDMTTGEVIGGNKELFFNFELLYPLSKEYGIVGLAFFDAGNAWDEGEMFFEQGPRVEFETPPLGLYKSIGAGVRWNSPLGPIRLEYGYGLDDLYDSSHHKIEFSMGQLF